jgi:hypothetical protein
MNKDIEPVIHSDFRSDSTNISDIGKYDKFINFVPMPKEYDNMVLFPKDIPFMIHNNEMSKDKLTESERFLAMERMQNAMDEKIKEELKENYDLQKKIEEIEDKVKVYKEKAQLKIQKLEKKPRNKIKEKYNYSIFDEYFDPKLDS